MAGPGVSGLVAQLFALLAAARRVDLRLFGDVSAADLRWARGMYLRCDHCVVCGDAGGDGGGGGGC